MVLRRLRDGTNDASSERFAKITNTVILRRGTRQYINIYLYTYIIERQIDGGRPTGTTTSDGLAVSTSVQSCHCYNGARPARVFGRVRIVYMYIYSYIRVRVLWAAPVRMKRTIFTRLSTRFPDASSERFFRFDFYTTQTPGTDRRMYTG